MLVRNNTDIVFTSLHHHIDCVWFYRAYQLMRKDGAVGVNDQTAAEYESIGGKSPELANQNKVWLLSSSDNSSCIHSKRGWKTVTAGVFRPLRIKLFSVQS